MTSALIVLALLVVTTAAAPQSSPVYKLEELPWPRIAAFDRERTLFILPAGVLEEHGPHLPIAADTLGVMYEANRTAQRVSRALPGWNVVMMPAINYGNGGANQLGDMFVHPGTYQIRQSTVRSLVADIGGQVAQNGFKWIFVLNGHGAPAHSIALNEACDFVSETFHVTMLHLTGLFRADAAIQARGDKMKARFFTRAELDSIGMDVHAGVSETAGILAVRPDLVQSTYKTLPSLAGKSFDELRKITIAPGWQGYLSSPAKATPAYGRAVEEWWIDGFTDLILRAVRGENMLRHPRDPETLPPPVAPILEKALANEAAFEAKLATWLAERGKRTTPVATMGPPQTCESLASAQFPQVIITAATSVAAGDFTPAVSGTGNAPPSSAPVRDLPAFCRIAATLKPSTDSDIKIEVWMPVTGWNGKFMGIGNGGWAGTISYGQLRSPLQRGYAVASTDTGHSGSGLDGSFALGHPEKLVDFGYRAVHEMTVTSKAIVKAFYGQAPRFSYWFGGSTGGKQGLTEAQRYPEDYDGIIAGAPVNYWSRVMSHLIWVARATHDDPAAFIPPDKFPAIHKAVVAACDAGDGLRDNLVSDPRGCKFDPSALLCSGADGPACLTAPQVQAAKKIYGPATDPRTGRVISPGLLPGSELAWHPAAAGTGPFRIVDDYFKYIVFKNAEWDYRTLDFDKGVALAHQIGDSVLNATDPDLSTFERRGGKLLLFHGWSDELISPLNTVEYYEAVVKTMGAGKTGGFLRLFMVPGMGHGLGAGPGPNNFDMVEALEQWVEKGVAPASVLASHRTSGKVDRTRPLCPYPQVAVYNGSGDSDEAASFTCKGR